MNKALLEKFLIISVVSVACLVSCSSSFAADKKDNAQEQLEDAAENTVDSVAVPNPVASPAEVKPSTGTASGTAAPSGSANENAAPSGTENSQKPTEQGGVIIVDGNNPAPPGTANDTPAPSNDTQIR